MDGSKGRRLFSLRLLLLFTQSYRYVPFASGQQAGVSLMFLGETLPSDSFVDFDDVFNVGRNYSNIPSNRNPGDGVLQCVTDLIDCCGTESGTVSTVHGNWYFPDGRRVEFGDGARFLVNRGPNEVINGTQFNGSVRLFRRYSAVPERGRFFCELPSAADPSVNQALYVNILNFGFRFDLDHVTFSPSTGFTATSAGQRDYSLTCSATLFEPSSLPSDVPSPNFQWSFSGSTSLPSGVTAMPTVMSSSNSTSETYTSTLQFNSPLSQSLHAGMYTCQLGPGRLENNAMITVNAPAISVQITTRGSPSLGQSGYSLTCGITGAENLSSSITYQWTKNNGAQTQVQNDEANPRVSFSHLRPSDAGRYTCQTTVGSPYLDDDITTMDTQDVILQIPAPTSVALSSSIPNPISPFGSDVILTCAVELSPVLVDVPVIVNTVLTTPARFTRTSTAQLVMGSNTSYASTFLISSFGRSDSGIYVCAATISSTSNNPYISGSSTANHSVRVTTGVYLALRGIHITNNSYINTRNIGQTSDNPNGALQCITDNIHCCLSQNPQLGEWYQPNGELVQGTTSIVIFYRTRGDDGVLFLSRPSDIESPTGLFCCEVPDATNTNQTLCVNIGLSITASGSPIAGESYILECSASGSEGTIQWLGPPDGRTPVIIIENSPRVNITSNTGSSQLQFRPIQQSDNGLYSCSATIDGSALTSDPVNVAVNVPPLLVQISNGGATPTLREDYQLICSISGANNLNPNITYQWTKNSGFRSGQIQIGANSNTLSFTPLRLPDAASYVCTVTITSILLAGDTVIANSQDIRIQIPTQSLTSIMLTSSGHSGIQITGSDVTLTCAVELNSAIQSSEISLLTIEVQLSRNGTPLTLNGPTVSGTTYTYTRWFESFGRSDSGNYTCTATIQPQQTSTYLTGDETLQSESISIKAGTSPPLNVQATQSSSSAPVEVSWSPPSVADGANIITGYRIYYGNRENVFVQSVTAITLVGLNVDGDYVGRGVSIRSESDQLYSERISVPITIATDSVCSCTNAIGIAVGVATVVVCPVVTVITVIVLLCLWRKLSSSKSKNDLVVSANMAYDEVISKPMAGGIHGGSEEYENPDRILRTGASTNESPLYSKKSETPDPVYASIIEDIVDTTN